MTTSVESRLWQGASSSISFVLNEMLGEGRLERMVEKVRDEFRDLESELLWTIKKATLYATAFFALSAYLLWVLPPIVAIEGAIVLTGLGFYLAIDRACQYITQ